MGIPLTLKKRLQMSAPPRLLDDSSSSSTNSVPVVSERKLTVADAMKFLADVKAAGKSLAMKQWLLDFTEQGFHPGLITRAEKIFKGHRDLLVAFNMFLPDSGKCTMREE